MNIREGATKSCGEEGEKRGWEDKWKGKGTREKRATE